VELVVLSELVVTGSSMTHWCPREMQSYVLYMPPKKGTGHIQIGAGCNALRKLE